MGRSIAIGSIALALGVHPATALDPHMRITQYFHTAWRVQDGAFEAASNAVTQTADGYIWIGTGSGFVTYDGARFEAWVPLPGCQAVTTEHASCATAASSSQSR